MTGIQTTRPISNPRKQVVGLFKRNETSRGKTRKSSNSPLTSARRRQGVNSVERMSYRSTKQLANKEFNSVNQSKRSYKPQKAHLKILLNGQESISPSPNSARAQSRPRGRIDKSYESVKTGKNLKSCKSVRSIGSKGYSSTRSKRGTTRYNSTKNYKSARNSNMYSNYLVSEPLSKLSMFNNLLGRHGPKRSIDTNQGSVVIDTEHNPFKRENPSRSRSTKRQPQGKSHKMYNYPDNQYVTYGNEYSNSAQTSQFTFGGNPDSRSDLGYSGTTSANKSINKDHIMYNMKDMGKQKSKRKDSSHRKSITSDRHQRTNSKTSKKSK